MVVSYLFSLNSQFERFRREFFTAVKVSVETFIHLLKRISPYMPSGEALRYGI